MARRGVTLDAGMRNALLHGFPLSGMHHDIFFAIHAHSRDFNFTELRAHIGPPERGDAEQERFEGGAGQVPIHHLRPALVTRVQRRQQAEAITEHPQIVVHNVGHRALPEQLEQGGK